MRALLAALVLVLPGTAAAAQPARPFGSHPQPLAAGAQQPRVGRAALDRATAAAYDLGRAVRADGLGAGRFSFDRT